MIEEKTEVPNQDICGLLVRRNEVGSESHEGRLISNLLHQIRNYRSETDPVASANLERFMGWSVDAIEKVRTA